MQVLAKLFGSAARVKIMRLFMFNPNEAFTTDDIAKRTKVRKGTAGAEIRKLDNIGLIKKKTFSRKVEKKLKTKTKTVTKKMKGWTLDPKFHYLSPLQNLLIKTEPLSFGEISKKFKNVGSVKLLAVTGVFIQEWDSRLDLLIVGNKIKQGALTNAIKLLESEIGADIRYAVFDTKEFEYRLSVYDKLIRDVLDYPHEKVINKMGI